MQNSGSIEETPGELTLAPLRFDYLLRPTTFLPLLLITALIVVDAGSDSSDAGRLSSADGYFASSFSYQAGLGEEALFRGVLQPALMEKVTGRTELMANLMQATVFSAAHITKDNLIPWPQFLMGFYLGWLTVHREYTLSENIFIHVWWDILAFGATYAFEQRARRPMFVPLISARF